MKKKKIRLDLDELKNSGVLNDSPGADIEIDGEQISGGKIDTVDTHWPTSAGITEEND